MTTLHRPAFHHVNLKTTRLQEMIEWYGTVIGSDVMFRFECGAWLSNDAANHRIAILAFPNYRDDPEHEDHAGMHHTAFEYESFDQLIDTYLRLRDLGILPVRCRDHGITLSYYYRDPDGNHVELQVDCFGDWQASSDWLRNSEDFRSDPLGPLVDPQGPADDLASGMSFDEIHRRARAGEYVPDRSVASAG
jgi:catechol 2,3-dioxygenase